MSTMNGSANEVVVRMRTKSANAMPSAAATGISWTVLSVATAVVTALPAMQLSSPTISRIAVTAEMRLARSIETENSAYPSW